MNFITKVKEPIPVNGIILNESLLGVKREIKTRQIRLSQIKRNNCEGNFLERATLQFELGRLAIIKQELILVQTLKIHLI